MPGNSSWMPCTPRAVIGHDDNDDDDPELNPKLIPSVYINVKQRCYS